MEVFRTLELLEEHYKSVEEVTGVVLKKNKGADLRIMTAMWKAKLKYAHVKTTCHTRNCNESGNTGIVH